MDVHLPPGQRKLNGLVGADGRASESLIADALAG
jgi:hypothetical protein